LELTTLIRQITCHESQQQSFTRNRTNFDNNKIKSTEYASQWGRRQNSILEETGLKCTAIQWGNVLASHTLYITHELNVYITHYTT